MTVASARRWILFLALFGVAAWVVCRIIGFDLRFWLCMVPAIGMAVIEAVLRGYRSDSKEMPVPPKEDTPSPVPPQPSSGSLPLVTQWNRDRHTAPQMGPVSDGWIRTARPWAELEDAVREYATLTTPEAPMEVEVVLAKHPDGFTILTFPQGIPVYPFVNLVGWLADGVAGTSGFVVPPGRTGGFALTPDLQNPVLDTLHGTGLDDVPIEVYVPEGTARVVDEAPTVACPALDGLVEKARFTVPMDAQIDFGNSTFTIAGLDPDPPSATALILRALAEDSSSAHEAVFTPDPDRMSVSIEELEASFGGVVRLAVTEWQDQWLVELPDRTWMEVHLEDGLMMHHASAAHASASVFLSASEDLENDEVAAMAVALGLPFDAGDRFDSGPGDYADQRARTVMALARECRQSTLP